MHKDHILYKVSCDRRPVRHSNLELYMCHDMENNKKEDMKEQDLREIIIFNVYHCHLF